MSSTARSGEWCPQELSRDRGLSQRVLGESGHEDHGDGRQPLVSLRGEVDPDRPGHDEVADHKVATSSGLDDLEGGRAIGSNLDREAGEFEDLLEEPPERLFVLHDEERLCGLSA